jgi:prepilin-type N-terminal cleavage/methylation domain-containing protein
MNTEMKNNQSAARRGKPRPGVSSTQEGFTLIELLVVIAIIGLLASLLLPTLVRAKESSRATVCRNDLRQIGLAAHMYADDYNDTFFCLQGGVVPYGGQWTMGPNSTTLRDPSDFDGYWALGYYKYFSGNQRVFGCPDGKLVDQFKDLGCNYPDAFWGNSTYGMCQYLLTPYTDTGTQYAPGSRGPLKRTSYLSPTTTIFCQDSFEQLMEGPDDSLGLFPGYTQILTKWKPGSAYAAFYPGMDLTMGWWRHNKGCMMLWNSGNVSRIRYTTQGVDYHWYTGERPDKSPF